MTEKILLVDDAPNLLSGLKRQLRKQFHLKTALGGEQGLEALEDQGPFAVIVSDMRMPDMDGIQLLSRVKERAPNTVRMMLTGNADLQIAIEAVKGRRRSRRRGMIEGIYQVAEAGMLPRTQKLDIIANNLANANTAGFKADRVFLIGLIDTELSAESTDTLDMAVTAVTEFRQGALYETENDLDLALEGDGFFAVETVDGTAYTRNGTLRLDAEGWLVNSEGMPILGWGGPIEIAGNRAVVSENGEVWVDGEVVDSLMIMDFPRPYDLKKLGNSLFVPVDPMEEGVEAEHVRVRQGFLEGSNVRPIEEMVDMLTVYRTYEAAQSTIKYQDETLSKAVNEVGSV